MDTAWIQVFVLTLAECVAPAGKAVCQEREFDLQFLTSSDCEFALEQFISLKDQSELVIVDKTSSRCVAASRRTSVLSNVDGLESGMSDKETAPAASQTAHQQRLEDLPTCEKSEGTAPCKMGGIIIEAATHDDAIDVWRHDP